MPIPDDMRDDAGALALKIRAFCERLAPTFAARRVAELLAHAGGELEKELRQPDAEKAAPVVEAAQTGDEIPM